MLGIDCTWTDCFIWIGAVWLFFQLIACLKGLVYFFGKSDLKVLASRYGPGSYALVTGCTEGIGKVFALRLAELGFNIVAVSRSATKLDSLKKEIEAKRGDCKVAVMQADFCADQGLDFYRRIQAQVRGLDISMIVNNVGIDAIQRFDELSEKTVRDLLQTNLNPTTFIQRLLLADMAKRKRAAVLTVSSQAGLFNLHHFNVYAGTKSFGDMLSRCLAREYKNIDFISLTPGKVSTAMNEYIKPDNLILVSAEVVVEGALNDLARGYQRSAGALMHKLQIALINKIEPVVHLLFQKVFLGEMRKERKLPPPKLYPE